MRGPVAETRTLTMYPELRLKAGREKSLLRRHPWVFSGAVERLVGEPGSGDTVDVLDAGGGFLARAAWSPGSQIRARVWSFERSDVVDAAFLRRRIEAAVDRRRRLGLLDGEGACRLVFSESDDLPGLVVDHYAGHLVCQLTSAGVERWRDEIIAALVEVLNPVSLYERSEGASRRKEGLASRDGLLVGAQPDDIEFAFASLRRTLRLGAGQKTGAYLDQQGNVAAVARLASGARVLDAFSNTGAFGLAALQAGAEHATFVDTSAPALERAAADAKLNGVAARCEFVARDVFEMLRELAEREQRFDLIVLDPPKFVHSAQQVAAGARGYKDVNRVALALLRPGGLLATFSCSGHVDALLFQKIVAGAALDAARDARIVARLGQSPDHPTPLAFPEADYLTGLVIAAD